MYEPPTLFYCNGDDINTIFAVLQQAGYSSEDITFVKLDEVRMQEANTFINKRLRTPFIYFPAENKTDWNGLGKLAVAGIAGGMVAVTAAPYFFDALGFSTEGVKRRSIAAKTQSQVYGGATGGLFSKAQSAGAAGIGNFGNAVIGLIGASVATGITAPFTSGGEKTRDHKLEIKTFGISKCSSSENDIEEIKNFIDEKLKIKSAPKLIKHTRGVDHFLSCCLSRAEDQTGESINVEVNLPAVIVFIDKSNSITIIKSLIIINLIIVIIVLVLFFSL